MKPVKPYLIFYFKLNNSNSGFAFVLIIIVVVLIFSIALVSGADKFVLSEEKPPASSNGTGNAPTPTPGGSAPTTTPATTNSNWNLTVSLGSCGTGATKGNYRTAQATVDGDSNGYISVNISDGSSYRQIAAADFTPPQRDYTLKLLSDLQFDTSSWQLITYSEGTKTANGWTGGTVTQTYSGNPTGC